MEGCTPDQQAKVAQFQEITANQRDVGTTVQLLKSCNWDVEQALGVFWASADEPSAPPPTMASASSSLATPLLNRNQTGAGSGDAAASSAPPGAQEQLLPSQRGIFGRMARKALTVVARVSSSVLGFLGAFLFGPMGQLGDGPQFSRMLQSQYPNLQFPRFSDGQFHQALTQARQDLRLLVVYLHSENARGTQAFCSQVLSTDFVRMMLDENFVCWGGDIARMEAHRVSQMIHARQYPCFCVLLPASIDEIRVIGMLHGEIEMDAVVALLTRCLEEGELHRGEIAARQAGHVEDRNLREAQDIEYQQALEEDRQREEEKRRKEQAALEEQQQKAEEQRRLLEEQEKIVQEKRNMDERRKQMAAALSVPDSSANVRVSMRVPSGQRMMRNFRSEEKLQAVYDWASCCGFLPDNVSKGVEIPKKFELWTSFPKQQLTALESTVSELQLNGQMLLLTEIDEDD